MPDPRRRSCRVCKRHDSEVGPISWGGLCPECGLARLEGNMVDIHVGHGLGFERRRHGIIRRELGPRVALALKQAGVFGTVLDDNEGAA